MVLLFVKSTTELKLILAAELFLYTGAPITGGLVALSPKACVCQVVTGLLSGIVVVPSSKSERNHSCKLFVTPPGP